MPVPITRTDWQLDRLISFVNIAPAPVGEAPRSTAGPTTGTIAGPIPGALVRDWRIDTDLILRYRQFAYIDQRTDRPEWALMGGVMNAPLPVLVDGRLAHITAFHPPPAPPADEHWQIPVVSADGNGVAWGAGYREAPAFDAVLTSGVSVTLSPALPLAGESAAILLVSETQDETYGHRTFALTGQRDVWAQLQEHRESIDGVALGPGELQNVGSTEVAEYIVRVRPPEGAIALLDGRGLYAVESVSEILRGRFWAVTGIRSAIRQVF